MPNQISNVSFMGPDADKQMEIQRRQMLAQSLQNQSQQPIDNQMSGGWAVPISPLQGLAKMAQAGVGSLHQNKAQELAKALGSQQQERRGADMSLLVNALQGRKASPGGLTEDAAGNVTQADPMQAQSPVQSLGQALPMLQDPQMQQMGMQALTQNIGQQNAPFTLNAGDVRYGPGGQPIASAPFKPDAPQGFTLPAGGQRYDHQGNLIATAPQPPQQPFTLPPGGVRYDPQGNQIAEAPRKPEPQQRQPQVIQTADGPMILAEDGTAKPITGPNGPVKPSQGRVGPMTATAQKELIETEEAIQGGQAALSLFTQARTLNDKAMGFTGAGSVASAGSLLPGFIRPEAVDATQNLDNILQTAALPQLKAIFGGMPTEGERKILLDVQGSSSKPPAVRKEIFDRAEKAIQARLKFAAEKVKRLRDGTYFSGEGLPSIQMDDSPAQYAGPERRQSNTDPLGLRKPK